MNEHLEVKTTFTDPDHHTIGKFFKFWPFGATETQVYFCDSWVENMGYWMTNVRDPLDRRNVSERAINRTYHEVRDWGDIANETEKRLLDESKRLFETNIKPILQSLEPFPEERERRWD